MTKQGYLQTKIREMTEQLKKSEERSIELSTKLMIAERRIVDLLQVYGTTEKMINVLKERDKVMLQEAKKIMDRKTKEEEALFQNYILAYSKPVFEDINEDITDIRTEQIMLINILADNNIINKEQWFIYLEENYDKVRLAVKEEYKKKIKISKKQQ